MQKIKLGVNIDHVATLRNARGENDPSLVELAIEAQNAGADLITVHLREDRRHIHDADVFELKKHLKIPLNFEMALNDDILKIALELKPATVCLVPERREEVTTEGGLNISAQAARIKEFTDELTKAGSRVFPFIEPELEMLKAVKSCGAHGIEFHTGAYARAFGTLDARDRELKRLHEAALVAHHLALEVHAGHGLNLYNVQEACGTPHLTEVNIGHALIARSLVIGLKRAIVEMKACIDAR